MFSSRSCKPNFLFKKCSRNNKEEVWSNTCEHTFPPRLQGDAIRSGTRYPKPIGAPRLSEAEIPADASCARLMYSACGSIPGEHFPGCFLDKSGEVKGGTWSKYPSFSS